MIGLHPSWGLDDGGPMYKLDKKLLCLALGLYLILTRNALALVIGGRRSIGEKQAENACWYMVLLLLVLRYIVMFKLLQL